MLLKLFHNIYLSRRFRVLKLLLLQFHLHYEFVLEEFNIYRKKPKINVKNFECPVSLNTLPCLVFHSLIMQAAPLLVTKI